jgi:LemA protein
MTGNRSSVKTPRARVVMIVAAAAVALVIWAASVYNGYARSEEAVHAAWHQVRIVEQRRMDLIPQLVRVTEAYAAHERSVIEGLRDARARYLAAAGSPAGVQELESLDVALDATMLLPERYPALHASELYRTLEFELHGSANRVAIERVRYNEQVVRHRTLIRQFPLRLFQLGLESTPEFTHAVIAPVP